MNPERQSKQCGSPSAAHQISASDGSDDGSAANPSSFEQSIQPASLLTETSKEYVEFANEKDHLAQDDDLSQLTEDLSRGRSVCLSSASDDTGSSAELSSCFSAIEDSCSDKKDKTTPRRTRLGNLQDIHLVDLQPQSTTLWSRCNLVPVIQPCDASQKRGFRRVMQAVSLGSDDGSSASMKRKRGLRRYTVAANRNTASKKPQRGLRRYTIAATATTITTTATHSNNSERRLGRSSIVTRNNIKIPRRGLRDSSIATVSTASIDTSQPQPPSPSSRRVSCNAGKRQRGLRRTSKPDATKNADAETEDSRTPARKHCTTVVSHAGNGSVATSEELHYFMPLDGIQPLPPATALRRFNRQRMVPGAHAVPGDGITFSLPDPPTQGDIEFGVMQLHSDQAPQTDNRGLVEAVMVSERNMPVAIPVPDCKKHNKVAPRRITWLWVVLPLLALIITVSTAASIACQHLANGTANKQSLPDQDFNHHNQVKLAIQTIFGDDYFEGNNEDLEYKKTALQWIVNDDPMQLQPDEGHLIQRFVLSKFYFQTSAKGPWDYCGQPTKLQQNPLCHYGQHFSEYWASMWLSQDHECLWAGITCHWGAGNERNVVEVALVSNNLRGSLPSEINFLSHLTRLYLASNMLEGSLSELVVGDHSLPGTIQTLHLGGCSLTGTLPPEIFDPLKFPNLSYFNLRDNPLTGTIPREVGLFQGTHLDVSETFLAGIIPSEISQASNLLQLFLGGNLSGTIPREIGWLKSLHYLVLPGNSLLEGEIPSELGLLENLMVLHLGDTGLNGTLPEEFYTGSFHHRLYNVDLGNCQFTGTISTSIGLLTTLLWLDMSKNLFSGEVPGELASLTRLQQLRLEGNHNLKGSIPEGICSILPANDANVAVDCMPEGGTGIPDVACPENCCTTCCDSTGTCFEV
ncbi:leucine Rich Repeat [Seminavis robusta]|uniref:Leucine Rich Repeat n=1 Tax=Seminavis robusta TaxID=568900 RepID=A0A9N8HUW5_9STRA|nr:leucine Rich Repeat [Seminavis robusta]|eukprot:Sro2180_g317960.1 leucine Rich Repeat (916) ;mRNA; r:6401-9295